MTAGQRIIEIRKIKKITQKEMSSLLECSQSNISDFEKDKHTPSYQFLQNLKKYLYVDINWLLTGEGAMFLTSDPPDVPQGDHRVTTGRPQGEVLIKPLIIDKPGQMIAPDKDFHTFKVVGHISAGEPMPVEPFELDETIQILKSAIADPKDCYCFIVNGASMEPIIYNGDHVIIQKVEVTSKLNGRILAVRDPDGLTLKVLFFDTAAKSYFLLPTNKEFKPIPLSENYHILGCLKMVIRVYPD